jgi:hypothetical protein
VCKNATKGYVHLKVPWGHVQVYPMQPMCLPHYEDDVVLLAAKKNSELHILGQDLPQMSVDDQKEFYADDMESLKDDCTYIKDGRIVKGPAPLVDASETLCPKCKLSASSPYCPICGMDLDIYREEKELLIEQAELQAKAAEKAKVAALKESEESKEKKVAKSVKGKSKAPRQSKTRKRNNWRQKIWQ